MILESIFKIIDATPQKTDVAMALNHHPDCPFPITTPRDVLRLILWAMEETASPHDPCLAYDQTHPLDNVTKTDLLLEIIMNRFDALKPFRLTLQRFITPSPSSVADILFLIPDIMDILARYLEKAGIPPSDDPGRLKSLGLGLIIAKAAWTWMDHDTLQNDDAMMAQLHDMLHQSATLVETYDF